MNYVIELHVIQLLPISARKQRGSSQRPMVVIPYVENVSEAVARIMRKHNVPVAVKPYKTLKSVLVGLHPKDKQEKED